MDAAMRRKIQEQIESIESSGNAAQVVENMSRIYYASNKDVHPEVFQKDLDRIKDECFESMCNYCLSISEISSFSIKIIEKSASFNTKVFVVFLILVLIILIYVVATFL